jgi:hypothetical protein
VEDEFDYDYHDHYLSTEEEIIKKGKEDEQKSRTMGCGKQDEREEHETS